MVWRESYVVWIFIQTQWTEKSLNFSHIPHLQPTAAFYFPAFCVNCQVLNNPKCIHRNTSKNHLPKCLELEVSFRPKKGDFCEQNEKNPWTVVQVPCIRKEQDKNNSNAYIVRKVKGKGENTCIPHNISEN